MLHVIPIVFLMEKQKSRGSDNKYRNGSRFCREGGRVWNLMEVRDEEEVVANIKPSISMPSLIAYCLHWQLPDRQLVNAGEVYLFIFLSFLVE